MEFDATGAWIENNTVKLDKELGVIYPQMEV